MKEAKELKIATIIRDTADIRQKMLAIWKLLDEKKIPTAEVRLHIGLAHAVLATLKVEIAAAHLLAAGEIHAVSIGRTAIKPITLQQ